MGLPSQRQRLGIYRAGADIGNTGSKTDGDTRLLRLNTHARAATPAPRTRFIVTAGPGDVYKIPAFINLWYNPARDPGGRANRVTLDRVDRGRSWKGLGWFRG